MKTLPSPYATPRLVQPQQTDLFAESIRVVAPADRAGVDVDRERVVRTRRDVDAA
jgi:hypothetical protein